MIHKAVMETMPTSDESGPRMRLWTATKFLVDSAGFWKDGLGPLYTANAVVSFLFNTITPALEERLRTPLLQEEFDRANQKPDAVSANAQRFEAMITALNRTDTLSCERTVTDEYRAMREAMRILYQNNGVTDGLGVLYTSSKTARKVLDLMFERLLHTYENDSAVVKTTDIPFEVMML